MTTSSPFIPVIPAGGSGTRLWPLSRQSHPKFLLDLEGNGASLLVNTLERLAPLSSARSIIVTGRAHREAVAAQVGDGAQILSEPSGKNSMPAIAWAAALAEREHPGAIIGSFAADHVIAPKEDFWKGVYSAIAAAELGYLATIGIEPTSASTAFGYIETCPSDAADEDAIALRSAGALNVARFVEKPDAATADEFVRSGRFMWNAGMFVVKARVLLEALDDLHPEISSAARALALEGTGGELSEEGEAIWASLEPIAIDHALAEPLASRGAVAVVPASFAWDDIGDFRALARVARGEKEAEGEVGVAGTAKVVSVDSRARVYSNSDRPIALVGLNGITVVEAGDVLLVVDEAKAQDVGALVKRLEAEGLEGVL
ncbi:mannose-1-phosphate guanylyltransferase [Dermabacter sp.]|uniref:mannose-1-phosphate guanylyltransferase n=1 Tax=Dermabacter sp. TaxID=37640 RepID=UPI0028FDE3E1|nr:mannose-1-phosphate guanylyltransferase [Dermabacter sp.]MDU1464729.1 mannose-1-phosphate guanylyltransferase [Dermabacter sp.]